MSDTHAASMNFVNALERLPNIIKQHEERKTKMEADIPMLQSIVAKTWGKEDELKQLKNDLASLDRKIAAELAPKQEEPEKKTQQQGSPRVEVADNPTQFKDDKESMVAEPHTSYRHIMIHTSSGGSSINESFHAKPRF